MIPEIKYSGRRTEYRQYSFPGYDVRPGASEGTLRDSDGLTADLYPYLSSSRMISEGIPSAVINGMFSDDYLCTVEGTEIYYNTDWVGNLPKSRAQSIYCVGDYLIFHPAGTFFNTLSMRSGTYGFDDNRASGRFTFGESTITSSSPLPFEAGDFICVTECEDSDNEQRHLMVESVSADGCTVTMPYAYFTEGEYEAVICRSYGKLARTAERAVMFRDGELYGAPASGCAVTTPGLPFNFKVGDCVSVSGSSCNDKEGLIIRDILDGGCTLVFDEGSFVTSETEETVSISRKIPTMTYACQAGNRLWCASARTIYASKLGDPFNWNVFDGLSTDSYRVDVGSSGTFTGCACFRGVPVFFKQQEVVAVLGSRPSNFELDIVSAPGILSGCSGSVKQVGQVLMYLSPRGVMAYAGSVPELISPQLGLQKLLNGVAETDGIRYWLAALVGGKRRLFTYDSRWGTWLVEDSKYIKHITRHGDYIYIAGTNSGKNFLDTITLSEEWSYRDSWYAEFGDMTFRTHDKKEVASVHLRMELGNKAVCRVLISYDGGEYEEVFSTAEKGIGMVNIPIAPRRCDRFSIRLEGNRFFALHYMAMELIPCTYA